jgi:glucose dehydrogenase
MVRFLRHRLAVLAPFLLISCASAPPASRTVEWGSYGSDPANSKYSALAQIDRRNLGSLVVAWRWRSPESEVPARQPELWSWAWEATPLILRGARSTPAAR